MSDRLTNNKLKTICDGYFVNFATKEEATKYRMLAESAPKYEELYKKLAEYEDMEEQGLLLKLPCKVGDIIYEPTNRNTINEYRVTGIKREVFALWLEWKLEKGFIYQSIYGVEVGDIGKTVFLTREEAEQALKQMGE